MTFAMCGAIVVYAPRYGRLAVVLSPGCRAG
ncbi:MAG: hypothetical protein QOE54_6467 [Streptosporangiaceae bacterium]|jgi:hypothetical protein|nr:hypothetical protein [Streptosporangiaceae bacterium]